MKFKEFNNYLNKLGKKGVFYVPLAAEADFGRVYKVLIAFNGLTVAALMEDEVVLENFNNSPEAVDFLTEYGNIKLNTCSQEELKKYLLKQVRTERQHDKEEAEWLA